MGTLLTVMAGILATWGVAAAVLIGLGLLVRRITGQCGGVLDRPAFAECFWAGFAVLLLFLQAWHFVWPVDWRAGVVVAALGVLGLGVGRRSVRPWLAEVLRDRRGALVIGALACVWLANRAMGPPGAFDSGMYHIPAVEWFSAHAVVPGLGNLHGRLAFNNSSLLYTALLDVGPWRHRSEHLATGLLLAALMVQVVFGCVRLLRGRAWSATDAFLCVLLFPCLYLATDPTNLNMASPTTDGAAIIVTFVSAAWLVSLLTGEQVREEGAMFRALGAALLMAVGVTIKLSTIGYAAVGWVVLAAWWVRRRRDGEGGAARTAAAAVVLAVVMAGTWTARGIVLSGYPVFPVRTGAVNVDWRVPEERARYHEDVITLFGRYDGATWLETKGLDEPWLREWVKSALGYKFEVVLPAALCGLCLLAIVAARRTRRRTAGAGGAGGHGGAWWLGAALSAGLVLWFVKAPQPRLALHLAWSLAGLSLAMTAMELRALWGERRAGQVVAGLVCVLSAGMLGMRTLKQIQRGDGAPLRTLVIGPGPKGGLHPAPEATLEKRKTKWGLEVHCPVKDGRVWHAPLITTCEFDERLRLRDEQKVGAGFRCVE